MKPALRIIAGRPVTAKPTMQAKREKAIAYLRSRNLYVLDKGSKKPTWGNGSSA